MEFLQGAFHIFFQEFIVITHQRIPLHSFFMNSARIFFRNYSRKSFWLFFENLGFVQKFSGDSFKNSRCFFFKKLLKKTSTLFSLNITSESQNHLGSFPRILEENLLNISSNISLKNRPANLSKEDNHQQIIPQIPVKVIFFRASIDCLRDFLRYSVGNSSNENLQCYNRNVYLVFLRELNMALKIFQKLICKNLP